MNTDADPLTPAAAPVSELVKTIGLPPSTFAALVAKGDGPRIFKLGRRNYVLLEEWRDWLEARAATATSAA